MAHISEIFESKINSFFDFVVNELYELCSHQYFVKSQYIKHKKKLNLFKNYAFQGREKHVNLAPFCSDA